MDPSSRSGHRFASWSTDREELPHLLQELGAEGLVVDLEDEGMDDGAGDGRRDRCRLNACPGVDDTAHQHAVQTLHHAPEGSMLVEEAHHHRIPLEDARHAAGLDGEVDHPGDQQLARSRAGPLRFRGGHRSLQTCEHDLGDGEDDLVLGVVLVIDGCLRHADRVRDHLQGRAADAVLGEEDERGFDDPGLGGRMGSGAQGTRSLRYGAHLLTITDCPAAGEPIGFFGIAARLSCAAQSERGFETMRRTDGELILLWTLPALGLIWISAFFLFPGFLHPVSPTMSAGEVAAFFRDPENLPRIRYSMILFNWFCVGLIPILTLIVMQIRRMAHRTPIFSYCILCCATGGPTLFLLANLFWLLAAFRPERDPALIQLFNDLAWVTFATQVPYLIAQSVILALAIYLDDQDRPVFK